MKAFKTSREFDEAARKTSLRKMKVLSTLLLVGMTILYGLSRSLEKHYPFFGLLRAFSEASMIGALADWFAVVALFKHPLNLPIPHTAIIKRNKDKLGDNLANFIQHNFLAREELENSLKDIDVMAWIGKVLFDPDTSGKIAENLAHHLLYFMEKFDDEELRKYTTDLLLKNLHQVNLLPIVGEILSLITREERHQLLLDEALIILTKAIENNKDAIRETSRGEYPRWFPHFLDDLIFNNMLARFQKILADIHDDAEHDLRKKFDDVTEDFIQTLKHSNAFAEEVDSMRKEVLSNPLIQKYFEDLWSRIKNRIMDNLKGKDPKVRDRIQAAVLSLGKNLLSDSSLREKLNLAIKASLIHYLEDYVDAVKIFISDTVKGWDAERTSRIIELYIGSDLQWIRINGTLIGGLAGLFIYILSSFFE
ncbi:Uncharacterized membrane-anchored protein YjiN, DUF445 family [Syntrophus gentianae]|uniref:Uncharacterized membrane-anchored protein YjiN, DUF445 family n=1 Tax=Syntrophus gentianae TaxID=43775 RepID=A0A1H7WUY9_9BACT|nr:DUF445 family protein [Syntrophus gentianae]SEM25323.1 Uncharacterized membrane-anchored protein YjiN, DUF445 family [Syntrophus gentianae]